MSLGRITGRVSTNSFSFIVEGAAKKFGYVKVAHRESGNVLAQILEIEHTSSSTTAYCNVIGYRDRNNVLKPLSFPFEHNTAVERADDDFVKSILGLEALKNAAYIGVLDGRTNLKISLDLNKLITKHIFVTGKSGSGKSYTAAVILEELLDKKVPLVIIDPHGEYSSLAFPSDEREKLGEFSLTPKAYAAQIREFSPDIEANPNAKPLKLNSKGLTPSELLQILPAKLSSSQLGILYSALKNLGGNADFNELVFELEASEESSSKWTLINMLDYIKKLDLLSENPTLPSELVQQDKCSIINLRGIPPEVQEVIVYKIANDLFTARKKGNIPPFFLVIEEAQNFCPERNFGEAKSSPIIRQVTAEGRKFGMGMCVISQRPSRVDKCIHPETELITEDNEFISIGKLAERYKQGAYEHILAYNFKIGKIVPTLIKGIAKNKKKERIYHITTGRGYSIKCTGEHRLFAVDNGKIIEKEASKLTKKDLLLVAQKISIIPNNAIKIAKSYLKEIDDRKKAIKKRIECYGLANNRKTSYLSNKYTLPKKTIINWKCKIQKPAYLGYAGYLNKEYLFGKDLTKESQPIPLIREVSPDLARFFAFMIAESDELRRTSYSIRFTNEDPELVEQFEGISKHLFGIKPKTTYWQKRRVYTCILHNILLQEYFEQAGYRTCLKSKEKEIPSFIINADMHCIRAFLQTYFDCDGGVTDAGVVLSSISNKVITKISFMLKRLAIEHSIYRKRQTVNGANYISWQIIILTRELGKYSGEIGFYSSIKKKKLDKLIKRKKNSKRYIVYDYVPYTKSMIYSLLKSPKIPKSMLKQFSKLPNNEPLTVNRINMILPFISVEHKKELLSFMDSDIRTDKIKNIELEGLNETYDIETEHGNFLANYILTHNSVISQVSTQIIMKVTNPHDIKALSSSIEGITAETEGEIKDLPVGTGLVTGVIDLPLFVNIRPRRTKHGGEAVNILSMNESSLSENAVEDMLLLVMPKITARDIELMEGVKVKTVLSPAAFMLCKQGKDEFNLLIDLSSGKAITNLDSGEGSKLLELGLGELSPQQDRVFKTAMQMGKFKPAELFAKSGVQFSDLYDLITVLVKKGYFEKEGDSYSVSGILRMFSSLKKLASYEKPEFGRVKAEKLSAKFSIEKAKEIPSRFAEIKSLKECWIVKYCR